MEVSFKNPSAIFPELSTNFDERYLKRENIVIPVIAQKILITSSNRQGINIFEETLLKLLKNGKKSAEELTDIIKMDDKLVSHIIEELEEKKFIKNGVITEDGKVELVDDSNNSKLEYAYIFYDLVGKFYWNIVMSEEEFQNFGIITAEKQKFKWKINDERNPGNLRFHVGTFITPKSYEYTKPQNYLMIEAIKSYKKRKSKLKKEGVKFSKFNPIPTSKIQITGDPIPLVVPTFIYISSIGSDWQVCHPFGHGISIRYRDILERYMELSEKNEIKTLLDKMYSGIEITGKDIAGEKQKTSISEQYIKDVFTSGIESYSKIFKLLNDLYSGYKELYSCKKSGKNYEKNQNIASDFIQNLYVLLEEGLYELSKKYEEYDVMQKITKSPSTNSMILLDLIKKLGFKEINRGGQSFFKLHENKIRNAEINRDFRSLISVNILIASDNSDHPFNILGEKGKNLINFLINLHYLRGGTAHASEEELEFDLLKDSFKKACIIISYCLENVSLNYIEPDFSQKKDETELKIYTICENRVNKKYGSDTINKKEFSNLKKYLIESEIYLEKIQNKIGNEKNIRIIVALGKVYEEILSILKKEIFLEEFLEKFDQKSQQEMLEFLEEKLLEFGFEVDFENFPKYFVNINIEKIKNTFKNFRKGVLTTKFYVIMYSAAYLEPEIIKIIGKKIPELVRVFAEVNNLRGHGNREISQSEAEQNMEKTSKVVVELLKVFDKNRGEKNG